MRGRPEAVAWLNSTTEEIGIAGFAAVELIAGCHDTRELRNVRKFMREFPVVWASEGNMNRTLTEYAPFFFSHGLGGFDALIAATATGQGATLYTFNEKRIRSAVSDL